MEIEVSTGSMCVNTVFVWLLVFTLVFVLVLDGSEVNGQSISTGFSKERPTWFQLHGEFVDGEISPYITTYPWLTGYGLWPILTANTVNTVKAGPKDLLLFYPAATVPAQRYFNASMTRINPNLSAIQAEQAKMVDITATAGLRAWWDVMPEWDTEGGHWIQVGDTPFTASTRLGMYTNFRNYVSAWTPLWTMLQTPQATRGFWQTSVCVWVSNVHYAYEWGLDMALLERAIDNVGDIATGISFIRGAGAQYNKPWGIDMAFWRSSANSASEYNTNGQLIGGFSESYIKRHTYISYMSGANMIHFEPVLYKHSSGALNPMGLMAQQFANFAVTHPTRGQAVVPFALMLDFHHGFVPKHWLHRPDNVWYTRLGYSTGDWMLENFFNVAYPGYDRHGLSTGWDGGTAFVWTDWDAFHNWIIAGNDPRPFEPMPNSKWGNVFDVLLSNAPIEALNRYKVVMMAGGVAMTPSLNAMLTTWVTGGGTLIINSQQVTTSDATLLGVTLTGTTRQSSSSKWLDTGITVGESLYSYQLVTPTTATVLARNSEGDPLVTRLSVGKGMVYLVTPNYMQDNSHSGLLKVGVRLLDDLVNTHRLGWVEGPSADYLTTQGTGFATVTVVNNSGTPWQGNVKIKQGAPTQAVEWTSDQVLPYTMMNGITTIAGTVPPYDVRVFALTGGSSDTKAPQAPANLQIR